MSNETPDQSRELAELESLLARDPSNDAVRRSYIGKSVAVGRAKDAAHFLSRALRSARQDSQPRIGVDIGLLYLEDGDRERARRAFAQVVDGDGDAPWRLAAARRLLDLLSGSTPQALVRPLAVLAQLETDLEARTAAASELLEMRGRARLDAPFEIAAWRALWEGPRAEEALAALEALYEASGDRMGLCEALARRAEREADPTAAQALALRSAELCGTSASDPEEGLTGWRRYVARYGPSRQAHARMIPLLERGKKFVELAQVLADEIELTPEGQRAPTLGRLGEVRIKHLADPEAGIELLRRSLELSPRETRSRICLEELLGDRDWALRAADVLEPLYRSEPSNSERAQRMLIRVLAVRAESAPRTEDRLRACIEIGELFESAGQRAEALVWYERAWALDPTRTDLLGRVDAIAESEGQSPEHRLERYAAAVDRVDEAARRAELLHAIGVLERSRGDLPSAIATWRRALQADPTHGGAHEALLQALAETDDADARMEELRRALEHSRGKPRQMTLVRMGEALAARGRHKEALELCRPILDEASIDDRALPILERLAEEAEDVETARLVLERGVDVTENPEARARAFERFGEFLEAWAGDIAAAARCWKAAAEEYLSLPGKGAEALRLLERALDHIPDDVEPARHLLELYLEAGEWSRMPEVYALLLRRSENPGPAIELLLSLESSAVLAGAATEFSELVENALWRLSDVTSPWKHPLIVARARVFASAGRREDAAEVYRMLLELYADEDDANAFHALIHSSPPGDWRRDNRRWLYAWRTESANDPVPLLIEWATIEEREFADPHAAIALWERAAVRDPSRAQIWEALVRLKIDSRDVEGGLDAMQPLRGLLDDETRLSLELQMATTLIERLDRTDRALPLLGSVLEKAPADAAARQLAFRILRSSSPLRARAGELLEQASSTTDSPEERAALLEQLLDATGDAETREPTPLAQARRRWFERLFSLTRGEACFAVNERAVLEFPDDDAIWQRLELLSCQLEDPQRALRAYLGALAQPISSDVAEMLGRRLLAFAEERAQSPQIVTAGLERVLELSPGARWAVDRVKLALTAERRWPSLIALYERAATAAADDAEKADLFDETAMAARDVAGDLDCAIDYWERVLHLRPGDTRVDLALERLYEKQGHIAKLIAHLMRRAEASSPAQLRALRERVASLWLDLSEGGAALEVLEALLAEDPDNEAAYRLLERVFALDSPGAKKAGARLEQRYAKTGRSADLARVLERQLALASSRSEKIERLKSLFEVRYAKLGDRSNALECLGELVALEPKVRAHRDELVKLAAELGANERLVELLVAAADRASQPRMSVELLRQAAAVSAEQLSDPEGAADLYLRILAGPYENAPQVDAARALSGLLEKIVEPEHRCDVLERLASFETEPEAHRRVIVEAARVASEELRDPQRAVQNLRLLIGTMPNDRDLLDRFVSALRAAENYPDLASALAARIAVSEESNAHRDMIELARIRADKLSEPERAIEVWYEVRRRFGRDAESFQALARLLEDRGRWPELASLLGEEASAAPLQADLLTRLGDVHREHTGETRAAIEAYIAAGEPMRALHMLESDERLLSRDPLLCVTIAEALGRAGVVAEAESLLLRQLEQESRRRSKEHAKVHLALAGILRAAGREKEAFERLSTAAELYPTDAAILAAFAEATFTRGDLERAEKTYQTLLLLLRHSSEEPRASHCRAEVYVELGEIASRRGEEDRARDLVASALDLGAESEEEHRGLERALRRRGKLDLLESALETRFVRATNPASAARALAALVSLHRDRQMLTDAAAAQMIERADRVRIELGPRPSDAATVEAFQHLVDAYVSLGQSEQAVEVLDVMSSSSAPDEGIRFGLEAARLLVDVPFRRDEAATRLHAIWKRDTARADVALLLSRVLEEEGRFEEALAVHGSLPLQPGRERETLEAIVRLEQARGEDPSRVGDALERLLEFEQGARRADVARRLSVLREQQGDREGMERAVALGFAADPTRAELRDQLIDLYVARGALTEATGALERALEATSDASLRWRLSEIHQKAGNTDAALRALDFAVDSRAEKAQLGRKRFLLLEAAGRTEDALTELESAYHADARLGPELLAALQRTKLPSTSERWALLSADLLVRYGEPGKAHRALASWLEANPESRPALRRLAKIAAKERNFNLAIDAYEKLVRVETGEARKSAELELVKLYEAAGHGRAETLLDQAEAYLADDELVDAFDVLAQAHRLDKSDTQVSFLLGLVAIDLDRIDTARTALRAFVAARPPVVNSSPADEPTPVSRAYFHLAVIEHARGDDGAAQRMVSRAMEESPNNRDAKRLRDELRASPSGN